MESKLRSFVKAFSYRFFGLFTTMFLVWILTKRIDWAAFTALADTAIKVIAFYFHERVWQKISYGQEYIEYEI